jgi:glucokinase
MGFSHEHMLLGDIGATNARLALLSNGILGPIKCLTVSEFSRFTDAVSAFLDCHCRPMSVPEALLAVAGPVDEDRCVLTNCPWTIDAPELRAAFGFAKVHICNDFEATALSLHRTPCCDIHGVRVNCETRLRCDN